MISFPEIETILAAPIKGKDPADVADSYLAAGEAVLENWIVGRDDTPTDKTKEGFRLLALHSQGSRGVPSFNACRETCRELAYHYNLITLEPEHAETSRRLNMMALIANHLHLFVSGKMQVEKLGEFCCASKPIRGDSALQTH